MPETFPGDADTQAARIAELEAALARSRNFLREAQEFARMGSWEWDLLTGKVHWSAQQARLFGEDPGTYEPSLAAFMEHVLPADREHITALLQAAFTGDGEYEFEHDILLPGGAINHVLEKGTVVFGPDRKPLRMLGTTRDLTERRRYDSVLAQKQKELEVQSAFLESIVDNIPTAVFIKDIKDEFRVTLWNKAAEEVFQVGKKDILGKTAHDLWPKDQADQYLAADQKVAREKVTVDIPEEPSQTKDRGTVYFNTIKMPLAIKNGSEPEYLLAMCTDITRYKRITMELQAAKETAEKANQAKGDFLAMMSHEIRTPMNGVIGMAHLLSDTPLNQEQADMVDTMKYSGAILLSLIDDILDYSKLEAGKMGVEIIRMPVEDAIREIADTMRTRADQKGLDLDIRIDAGKPLFVEGDPVRVRQVLLNLIGNAIKFTLSGGITIHVDCLGNEGRVCVTDTGIGIDESARSRLFNKFSQAEASTVRKFGGTGLGLALSKSMMELMGGKLEFTSEPGKGSTFCMTLPLSGDQDSPSEGHAPNEKSLAQLAEEIPPGLRVLMAEDNTVNQKVCLAILKRFGCAVDVANDGSEAVKSAKAGGRYDLILMDIQMPNMDGLEATRAIRAWEAECHASTAAAFRKIPIIALSAGVTQTERENCRDADMDDFLTKPVLAKDLARVFKTLFAQPRT